MKDKLFIGLIGSATALLICGGALVASNLEGAQKSINLQDQNAIRATSEALVSATAVVWQEPTRLPEQDPLSVVEKFLTANSAFVSFNQDSDNGTSLLLTGGTATFISQEKLSEKPGYSIGYLLFAGHGYEPLETWSADFLNIVKKDGQMMHVARKDFVYKAVYSPKTYLPPDYGVIAFAFSDEKSIFPPSQSLVIDTNPKKSKYLNREALILQFAQGYQDSGHFGALQKIKIEEIKEGVEINTYSYLSGVGASGAALTVAENGKPTIIGVLLGDQMPEDIYWSNKGTTFSIVANYQNFMAEAREELVAKLTK